MMTKNDKPSVLSIVPAWLAMPLMTLMALGLVAFSLMQGDLHQWQDLVLPAILGSVLLLVMGYWLLHIRRVEQRLREERNLLQVLINHLPDRVFIKDLQGRRLLSNSADWQAAGATKMEEVIGKTVFELFTPELASKYAADDEEILKTGKPVLNHEQPSVDIQGMPIWTLATEVPLCDTHGNSVGIVGIVRDITAFKQATEAGRVAEERYRRIFEESVEGIYQTKSDGTILTVNPALAQMLGYTTPEEMLREMRNVAGQVYTDPSRRAEFKSQIEANGTIAGFESEIFCKGGDTVWISENGRVVRGSSGEVLYYEGTMVDITERKRAEEAQRKAEAALHESEERFSSAFAYAAIGMALVAPDGRWIKVNRALCDLVGYSEEELLGMAFQDITHPDDLERDLNHVRRMLAGEIQTYRMEKRYYHKSGRLIWILLSVSLVRGADGTPQHFVSQIQDISERKQAEESQRDIQRKQSVWISELEQRTREISLLNEMSDLIQCCPTVDEAYNVIEQQAQWLFPQDSGALYIINASRNLAEVRAAWGEHFDDLPAFKLSDCWAFRRGRLHVMESIWADDPSMSEPRLVCSHIHESIPEASACVPLIAQGETLGLLHLRSPKAQPSSTGSSGIWYTEAKRQLVRTVADSLALSISNLSLRDKLRQQSIRDPLTGLFNRRYLEESLDREIARSARAEKPLGVIMLDIDHFKHFNDLFGHAAGDAVLRELGMLLSSHVREADIACRYGGEEFALIMPDASLEVTQQRAEQLREAIAGLEAQQGGQLLGPITASVGVAEFPRHGRSSDAVIQMADAALYQAKQGGRNQIWIADCMDDKPENSRR